MAYTRKDFETNNLEIFENGLADELTPPIVYCQFCEKALPTPGLMQAPRDLGGLNGPVFWKAEYRGNGKPGKFVPDRCGCAEAKAFWAVYDVESEENRKILETERQENIRSKWLEDLMDRSQIDREFPKMSFENYDPGELGDRNKLSGSQRAYLTCKTYVDRFNEMIRSEGSKHHGRGLYLSGGVGAGKTHLAVAVVRALTENGVSTLAIRASDLLMRLRQSYGSSDRQQEEILMGLYIGVEVLMVDDLGKSRATDWSLDQLLLVIDKRIANRRPIIVTTNYDDAELVRRLTPEHGDAKTAEAIVSRLRQACSPLDMGKIDQRMRRPL